MRLRVLLLVLPLLLVATAAAQTLDGVVNNMTTGRPAAGNNVVLLTMTGNMEEAGRTTTDTRGRFQLKVPDPEASYLVRVTHHDVNYFRPAPPGASSVEVMVYDAAPKVEGVSGIANVLRIQAEGNTMRVTEAYALRNVSDPPRTQMGERSFELFLPPGAEVQSSLAAGPGGMPVTSAPVPSGEPNRYYMLFPIRPGETRFQLEYTLPYTGSFAFEPRLLLPTDHLVVVLPKSMGFQSRAPQGTFQPLEEDGETTLLMAANAQPGQPLGFSVSGTGVIPAEGEAAGPRPGGGLGPPSAEPGPLEKYRWYLLGLFAVLFAMGAWFALRKPVGVAATPAAGDTRVQAPAAPSALRASPAPAGGRNGLLLEALKEELFQLEVERQSGDISEEEYERAKQALDVTIQRAVQRTRG